MGERQFWQERCLGFLRGGGGEGAGTWIYCFAKSPHKREVKVISQKKPERSGNVREKGEKNKTTPKYSLSLSFNKKRK